MCIYTFMEVLQNLLKPTQGCVCSAYRKASRAVTQHYEAAFRGSGLRATQFTILSVLAQTGPMPLSKFASELGMERTTLTRNLTPLVTRSLVELDAEKDARVSLVTLTSQGETVLRESFPLWEAAQKAVDNVLKKFS